jgi:hypothetical protein
MIKHRPFAAKIWPIFAKSNYVDISDDTIARIEEELQSTNNKVFVSYSRDDKDIVYPIIAHLLLSKLPIYIDILNEPAGDNDELAIGLSEGLTICQVLIAFISRSYLNSKWCRAELREFIYLHGKKVLQDDIDLFKENPPSYQFYNVASDLPQIPAIIVQLERSISTFEISEAVAPEDKMNDTIQRILAFRGDEDPLKNKKAMEYIRDRGIDASHYIDGIDNITVSKGRKDLLSNTITQKLYCLLNQKEE